MLYQFAEYQRALLRPLTAWAAAGMKVFADPGSPFAQLPGAPCVAAGWELLHRVSKTYEKPDFDIQLIEHDGETVPVFEQTVLETPFCRLLRFARAALPDASAQSGDNRPTVLLCAPLAGHHAVLLRETVQTLLQDHDVYVTDWIDARNVPAVYGPFHLDDYVAHVQAFIRRIGTGNLHVLAVCQATVPALGAIAMLASAGEPTPNSLILVGGPIDARRNATAVDRFAASRPIRWFQENVIDTVPDCYPGRGRKVYPGFLQHVGLVAMQPGRYARSHWDCYLDRVQGDLERAEGHRRFADAYHAVLDLAAEYYLDTVQIVFQEFRLARGHWSVRGEPVRPPDIRTTALLTIEGDQDDICGRGQTQAAHDLCQGVAARHKRHLTARRSNHYDLFSGPVWRTEVYPAVRELIGNHA
jgi:poly(3-hydroxybutyrate) depolymerase